MFWLVSNNGFRISNNGFRNSIYTIYSQQTGTFHILVGCPCFATDQLSRESLKTAEDMGLTELNPNRSRGNTHFVLCVKIYIHTDKNGTIYHKNVFFKYKRHNIDAMVN